MTHLNHICEDSHTINKVLNSLKENTALEDVEKSSIYKDFKVSLLTDLTESLNRLFSEEAFNRLVNIKKADKLSNEALLPFLQGFSDETKQLLGLLLWTAFNNGGSMALNMLDSKEGFILRDPLLISELVRRIAFVEASFENTTLEYAASKYISGMKFEEYQSDINKDNRVELVGTNESNESINFAEYQTFDRAGVEEIRWVTAFDENVCPICRPLDGVKIKMGSKFDGGVSRPPVHIRCRCFTEPVKIKGIDLDNIWNGDPYRLDRSLNTILYTKDVDRFEGYLLNRQFGEAVKIYQKLPAESNRKNYMARMLDLVSIDL